MPVSLTKVILVYYFHLAPFIATFIIVFLLFSFSINTEHPKVNTKKSVPHLSKEIFKILLEYHDDDTYMTTLQQMYSIFFLNFIIIILTEVTMNLYIIPEISVCPSVTLLPRMFDVYKTRKKPSSRLSFPESAQKMITKTV